MYNSDTPLRAELPTSKQLLRSTVLAAISALVLLVAVVLPAEYGIDPTGIGRVLRMTEMGDIKQQLAAEAAADAAAAPPVAQSLTPGMAGMAVANAAEPPVKAAVAVAPTQSAKVTTPKIEWRDEMPVTLKPGDGTEIKLKMVEGAKAQYAWVVEGGEVNFDTHGDAKDKSISYEKGRGVSSDEGVLEAAFTGNHGWYWRNRGKSDVKVILRTRGDYTDIKKMM
ncbi:MAG: transmembrane anchor protein [Gammaproteobacteria bacterium]|uniref:transmembrane anchor protein n=1 Tax=Rhodoferax sp. TaxID=50421 RepID=UPI0017B16608|nr:transmembrane anchor protein [Rhodoferax sp.]MBU3899825.1 transmembrane anchor protein [Gammaproteobacteria bacterium]MBA3059830.1 transmembrane anchor protein [Rhodoferax sp.]MBU3998856.1 transmembrane anchor protein [Gammaproteobacteria bacterium]MBU4019089.1 transmembrane anchor protein [Gammaproteobacteria bacterium]MBU4078808.1 transmembrane anchor protein [Gammaproteobacteria bacterium]